jgi:hypothetical protein
LEEEVDNFSIGSGEESKVLSGPLPFRRDTDRIFSLLADLIAEEKQ